VRRSLRLRECKHHVYLRWLSYGQHYNSIHLVHDDAKEKEFELELSWIGDETNGHHVAVPKDLFEEADRKAREALENFE
jgi:hypothetical protein